MSHQLAAQSAFSFVDAELELHDTVSRSCGLTNFGNGEYREGLRLLLESLDAEADLSAEGVQRAWELIVGVLRARVHAEEGWRQFPQVTSSRVTRPIVITGLPRTGSTALHRLLSVDTQLQGLTRWLHETPMKRPPDGAEAELAAYKECATRTDAFFSAVPAMRRAHDRHPAELDECVDVLVQNFVSDRFGTMIHVPSYDEWFFSHSQHSSYRRYAAVLRLIGAGAPQRRWLLKDPRHLDQLEELLDVFPDAVIVQTHRDPIVAMTSACSLISMSRRMHEGPDARTEFVGQRTCWFWGRALERGEKVRQERKLNVLDVEHGDFVREPLRTVQAIYDFCGLGLSKDVEARMRDWLAKNPTMKHGRHEYRLEGYGISEEDIRARFAKYRSERGYA